ncbi:MAG: fumarate hydratase C-terminal domain-containing protein [Lentisphaerae bacterium]|nr:fumarate hydratase C-terminal domain-containing protein [Lentisphaerota bacterium]
MKTLRYPFTAAAVKELAVGEMVSLSGRVFTARDRLHKHLYEGGRCPVNLKNGAIYHCGPIVLRRDRTWVVRAAGPTTSLRQEAYMPRLIAQHGIRVIVGKGGMGEGTRQACAKCGCVYVQAVGGAAALLAEAVRSVSAVHFLREFGMAEALWVLEVENLRGVVAMDAQGRSLYRRVRERSRRALRDVLRNGVKA